MNNTEDDIEFNTLIDNIKSLRIHEDVIKLVREISGSDDVYPHTKFDHDLSYDDLDLVDTIMRLEKMFDIYIPDDMCSPETVMDLIITVRSKISDKLKNGN